MQTAEQAQKPHYFRKRTRWMPSFGWLRSLRTPRPEGVDRFRREPRHCGDEGLRCLTRVRPREVERIRSINQAIRFCVKNRDCPF